jgi:hypothetical protein
MTAETLKTEGKPEPAYRKPNQTRAGRLRQEMTAGYIEALGGLDRISSIQAENIMRAVDLMMLAKTARAELAVGRQTINNVVKLENSADRAVRRLGIKPGAPASPAPSLQAYLASKAAAEETSEAGDI